jgi:hypothetical protein
VWNEPPPDFALTLPASVVDGLPPSHRKEIEEVVRQQKQSPLYRTPALLPALEIVRNRPDAFKEAAKIAGLDDRLFEGLIVLECGGSDDAIDYMFRRGKGKRAHVGLGQMGWIEGRSAGLKVTPGYETRLKSEIRRSQDLLKGYLFASRPHPERLAPALFNSLRRQADLMLEWREADERFDPEKNLRASARLLKAKLKGYDGDYSLAIASYHAGGGNIGKALRLARASGHKGKLTFWQLYADRTGPVYRLMSDWSDDSRNYMPKVLAAADIVEKYLNRPDEFQKEYLYWGPDNARERLAAAPYAAVRVSLAASGG